MRWSRSRWRSPLVIHVVFFNGLHTCPRGFVGGNGSTTQRGFSKSWRHNLTLVSVVKAISFLQLTWRSRDFLKGASTLHINFDCPHRTKSLAYKRRSDHHDVAVQWMNYIFETFGYAIRGIALILDRVKSFCAYELVNWTYFFDSVTIYKSVRTELSGNTPCVQIGQFQYLSRMIKKQLNHLDIQFVRIS
jgi:hypothetical protein